MTKARKVLLIIGTIALVIAATYYLNRPEMLIAQGDQAAQKADYKKALDYYKKVALLYPFSPAPHVKMASFFGQINDWEKAKQELRLAIELSQDKADLEERLRDMTTVMNQPQRIREEIDYWEKVAEEKPDYRDAWIQISIRYWQLYETSKAKEVLAKAKEIDPNNETVAKLEERYTKN